MFVIEDDTHADIIADFETLKEAIEELDRLSKIPWDEEPNRAPCGRWKTCRRDYLIIEYDTSSEPWIQLQTINALEIDAKAVRWRTELKNLKALMKIV